jgi:uncharacterized protein YqgV (UPF0045/DUF77 family)
VKLTAELSLYPLQQGYVDIIETFIESALKHDGITLVTNAMSTQVCGDYDRVMALIAEELRASYDTFGAQVLVCKLIPGELAIR